MDWIIYLLFNINLIYIKSVSSTTNCLTGSPIQRPTINFSHVSFYPVKFMIMIIIISFAIYLGSW
jgi:hypothetical protein